MALEADESKLNVSAATGDSVPTQPLATPVPTGSVPPPAVAPFDAATAKAHQAAWAKHLGEPVETTNSIGMRLVVIPPGEFDMGEAPITGRVTLTRPIRFGIHEVTQGQWQSVMNTEPWKGRKTVKEGADHSATYVNWDDAIAFCRQLTDRERAAGRLPANEAYRLPTGAEWEWACRAGTTTADSFGNDAAMLGDYAWFDANAYMANASYAHAVGLKSPNAWGLHDVQGNVWELCSDWHVGRAPGNVDPHGSQTGTYHGRGGSWKSAAMYCQPASRAASEPDRRDAAQGFRVVRSFVR